MRSSALTVSTVPRTAPGLLDVGRTYGRVCRTHRVALRETADDRLWCDMCGRAVSLFDIAETRAGASRIVDTSNISSSHVAGIRPTGPRVTRRHVDVAHFVSTSGRRLAIYLWPLPAPGIVGRDGYVILWRISADSKTNAKRKQAIAGRYSTIEAARTALQMARERSMADGWLPHTANSHRRTTGVPSPAAADVLMGVALNVLRRAQ